MKSFRPLLWTISMLPILVFGQESEWPKAIQNDSLKVVIYQPQTETMNGDMIHARAAFSVQSTRGGDPIFGALWADAHISTDRSSRTVYLLDATITDLRLPSVTDTARISRLKSMIEQDVNNWQLKMSLDALLASVEDNKAQSVQDLKTEAPEILFRKSPTALVLLDGDAKYQSMQHGDSRRIINTPYMMAADKDGNFFVYLSSTWYTSKSLDGAWSKADKVPGDLKHLQEDESKHSKDSIPTSDSTINYSEIIIRTHPAELLQTSGEPDYSPIQGTQLLFIKNTSDNIFRNIQDQSFYVLISGRWYTSQTLDGNWKYVASDKLPDDFAKIPEGSEKDEVLTSVAGTPASKEALLDAQVPQTAAVSRKEATCSVTYDGTPQFTSIPGTSLSYATNTSSSVIKDGMTYYVCDNGVWFKGITPNGLWEVATSVPKDVSKIPASSPVHNVRYVYIYDSTPDVVYVGYTPGYLGCYIYGPTVVYGTGWYYSGWYGTYYYPRPVTYGFNIHYNPWYGWSMGCSVSFGGGYYGGWWGPVYRPPYYYRPYYGGYYGGYRGGYRPPPPRPVYYGPRTNPVYGNHTRGVTTNLPPRPGSNPVERLDNRPRPTGTDQRNNVYSDRAGNIYRNQGNDRWQQNNGDNWKNISRDKTSRPSMPDNLNQQQLNRQRGDIRTNQFNGFQGRPGGMGGGMQPRMGSGGGMGPRMGGGRR